jgi:hypothetical protein
MHWVCSLACQTLAGCLDGTSRSGKMAKNSVRLRHRVDAVADRLVLTKTDLCGWADDGSAYGTAAPAQSLGAAVAPKRRSTPRRCWQTTCSRPPAAARRRAAEAAGARDRNRHDGRSRFALL